MPKPIATSFATASVVPGPNADIAVPMMGFASMDVPQVRTPRYVSSPSSNWTEKNSHDREITKSLSRHVPRAAELYLPDGAPWQVFCRVQAPFPATPEMSSKTEPLQARKPFVKSAIRA